MLRCLRSLDFPWEVVVAADNGSATDADFRGLVELVQHQVVPAVAEALTVDKPVLITEAAPLARYGQLRLLQELADATRPRPAARLLLLPARRPEPAMLDQVQVPLTSPSRQSLWLAAGLDRPNRRAEQQSMIELKALQGQVRALVDDLRAQVTAGGELRTSLDKEYAEAKAASRTGGTFEAWSDDVLDQAAVAWVLGCVFVRFCEDNRLVEPLWIGGPEPDASADRAMQARQAYIMAAPLKNDRHWLREAFTYLAGVRATGRLFDDHNPVWRFDISGEAAEALSDFFRRGEGARSLRSSTWDTRFLGDLYQDLSAHARSTYALLQTPVFVEEFILDRTFEPAVREFGLAPTSVIDPTCGSGHFLLGAFDRLVKMWTDREPATDIRDLVERALGQVTGRGHQPVRVGIARFRLMIAALKACGLSSLERAPSFRAPSRDRRLAAAVGRGEGSGGAELDMRRPAPVASTAWSRSVHRRLRDDLRLRHRGRGRAGRATSGRDQYTVVVGNPPYITVKDPVLNERYRREVTRPAQVSTR